MIFHEDDLKPALKKGWEHLKYEKRVFVGGPADGQKLEVPYDIINGGEFEYHHDGTTHRYRSACFHSFGMAFVVMVWVPMNELESSKRVDQMIRKALVDFFCDTQKANDD